MAAAAVAAVAPAAAKTHEGEAEQQHSSARMIRVSQNGKVYLWQHTLSLSLFLFLSHTQIHTILTRNSIINCRLKAT